VQGKFAFLRSWMTCATPGDWDVESLDGLATGREDGTNLSGRLTRDRMVPTASFSNILLEILKYSSGSEEDEEPSKAAKVNTAHSYGGKRRAALFEFEFKYLEGI